MRRGDRAGVARLSGLAAVLIAVMLAVVGPVQAQGEPIELPLSPVNGYEVEGTMTLRDNEDGTTNILIELDEASGDEPAIIHAGSCDALDPNPSFSLASVDEDGVSETDLEVPIGTLLNGGYAVVIHLSSDQFEVYVSCGNLFVPDGADVPQPQPGETPAVGGVVETPVTDMSETGIGTMAQTGTPVLIAILAAFALAMGGTGVALRTRRITR